MKWNMRIAEKRYQKMRITFVVIMIIYSFSGCMEQTPPQVMTGRIIAEDGSGISHAKVVYDQQEAFTDEEGYFSLEGSPEGDTLSVSKEGYIEMVIGVEAVEGQIDVGSIVLLEKQGDIIRIEELTEYVPDSAAENVYNYYYDLGFFELGTIEVVYTTGTIHITALVTSTQSAFIIESGGATGILFDFSEKTKEVYMGDIVLTAAFGGEWDVHLFLEGEIVWSSEDDEELQVFFCEMGEESEALEFIKSMGDIAEDSVHPDILVQARGSEEHADLGLTFDSWFQHLINLREKDVHLFEGGSVYRRIFDLHSLEFQLEFVSTLVYGLKLVINPPGGIRFHQNINWIKKRLAEDIKKWLEKYQKEGKENEKKLKNNKKDMEDRKNKLMNEKELLEETINEMKKHKKELEEKRKELEELKEEFKYYENEVKKIENEIEKIDKEIKEIDDLIERYKKEINRLEKEIDNLEKDIKNHEDLIEKIGKRLGELGRVIKRLDDIIKHDC